MNRVAAVWTVLRRVVAGCLLGAVVCGAPVALADSPPIGNVPSTGTYTAKLRELRGNVAVMELSGDYSRSLPDGRVNVEPRTVITKELYRTVADRYDFVVVFSNFEFNTGDAKAFYLGVRNDTAGIGSPQFDHSERFGSRGVLQGYIDMAALSRYMLNPSDARFEETMRVLAHELLHRWAAQVRYLDSNGNPSTGLLGREGSHWSFLLDTGGSVEYGNRWIDNGDGSFTSKADRHYFSPLDLYLMGMLKPEEVPPFFLIRNPDVDATRLSAAGVTVTGVREDITIDQIVAAEGARKPDADASQKQFRIGFVLLTRPGMAATDQQIGGVNAVRNAFETRLRALTGGRAIAHVHLEPRQADRVAEPTLPATVPGAPGSLASLFDGLSWLRARQSAQGDWSDNPLTRLRDTTVAMAALSDLGSGDQPGLGRAQTWLAAQSLENNDYVARRIQSMAAHADDADLAKLAAAQNPDGGWGVAPGYQSSPLDTALALLAFAVDANSARKALVRERARAFLLAKQNPDGGWSHASNGVSRTATTAQVIRALAGQDAAAQIRLAARFLAGRQNVDGGFGDSPSTTHDTSNVMLSLAASGQLGVVRMRDAFGYLNSTQRPDGSWDGSVYATGLALRSLGASQSYNWSAASLTAQPTEVRDGQRVALAFAVSNNGSVPAPATVARVYDGDPSAGVVIADIPVPPLKSGDAVIVRGSWSTLGQSGNHLLTAVIDPASAGSELTRSDNVATARVAVAPAPEQVDLVVMPGDVQVLPAVINRLPTTVSVLAQVANIGKTDAMGVKVRLLSGASLEALSVVDEKVVNLIGRGTVPVSTSFQVRKPGRQWLVVIVDPDRSVPDIDRANNRAEIQIDTVSSFDPAVFADELKVPVKPVNVGADVALRAVIHNHGSADSPPMEVVFTVGDGSTERLLARQTIQLQAGAEREITLPWRVDLVGPLEFKVQVDPAGVIADIDRSNNVASAGFLSQTAPAAVNLAVHYRDIGINPDPAEEGRELALRATVRNTGLLGASAFEVSFYDGDPDKGGALLGTPQAVASLAAGASIEVGVRVPEVKGTAERLYFVVADRAAVLSEPDREDNTAFRAVQVLAMPDLAIAPSSITTRPVAPKPGDTITVNVQVQNLGAQAARGVLVRLSNGGALLGEQRLALVAAHGAANAVFTVVLPTSANQLQVVVDPDGEQLDGNRANNSAVRVLTVQNGRSAVSEPFFSPNGDGVKDSVVFAYRLDVPVAQVVVVDALDRVVRRLSVGEMAQPEGAVEWDGRDDDQRLVDDGVYRLRALSIAGQPLAESRTTLDTNRTPILRASGTPGEYYRNLSCVIPEMGDWTASDDEQSLFIAGRLEGSGRIHRVGLQGGERSVVLVDGSLSGRRALSALSASTRGERLTFRATGSDGADELWVAGSDGKGIRLLSATTGGGDDAEAIQKHRQHFITPDGSAVIAWQQRVDGSHVLRRIPTEPGPTALTLLDGNTAAPDLGPIEIVNFWPSPDRRRAVIEVGRDEAHRFALVDLQTGALSWEPGDRVFDVRWLGSGVAGASWSGDSRHFVLHRRLDALRISTGNCNDFQFDGYDREFKLINTFRTDIGGDRCRSEGGGRISPLAWSSNGQEFVVVHRPDSRPEAVAGMRLGDAERLLYRVDVVGGTMTAIDVSADILSIDDSDRLLWAPADQLALTTANSGSGENRPRAIDLGDGSSALLFPKWSDERSNPSHARMQIERFSASGRRLFFTSRRDVSNPLSACFSYSGGAQIFSYESLQNLVADLQALRDPRAGGLLLRGTASDLNFAGYELEYANVSTPGDWHPVTLPGAEERFGEKLAVWVPPAYGNYYVRLTVADRAGNKAQAIRRVIWSDSPPITDMIKDFDQISPNGDGVQDSVKLSYRVLEPVHLLFEVLDASGQLVRAVERDHADIGDDRSFIWDGRDDKGRPVPQGRYTLRVLDYEFQVDVDLETPDLQLAAHPHAFMYQLPTHPAVSFLPDARDGVVEQIDFSVAAGTSTDPVTVTVVDGLSRTWFSADFAAGAHTFRWDGLGEDGETLPNGSYEVLFKRGAAVLANFVAELNRGSAGVQVLFRPILQAEGDPLAVPFSVAVKDLNLRYESIQLELGSGDPPADWVAAFKDRAVQSLPAGYELSPAAFGETSEGGRQASLRGTIGYLQFAGSRLRVSATDKAGNTISRISDHHPVVELVLLGAAGEYVHQASRARRVSAKAYVGNNFSGGASPIGLVPGDVLNPSDYQLDLLKLHFADNQATPAARVELRHAFIAEPAPVQGQPPRPFPLPLSADVRLLNWTVLPLRGAFPGEALTGVSGLKDLGNQIQLNWNLPHHRNGVWLLQLIERDERGQELRSNLFWVRQAHISKPSVALKADWSAYHEPALNCDVAPSERAHLLLTIASARSGASSSPVVSGLRVSRLLPGGLRELIAEQAVDNSLVPVQYEMAVSTADWPTGRHDFSVELLSDGAWSPAAAPYLYVSHSAPEVRILAPHDGQRMCAARVETADIGSVGYLPLSVKVGDNFAVYHDVQVQKADGSWVHRGPIGKLGSFAGVIGTRELAGKETLAACSLDGACGQSGPIMWPNRSGWMQRPPSAKLYGLAEDSGAQLQPDPLDGTVVARLRGYGVSGHLSCATVTVDVDGRVDASSRMEQRLFSPNGDGNMDEASVTVSAREAVTVTIDVFPAFLAKDGSLKLQDGPPIAQVLDRQSQGEGERDYVWNGRTLLGMPAPDGLYALRVRLLDGCGNESIELQAVELDNTPPTIVLESPRASVPLSIDLQIKGLVQDLHPLRYESALLLDSSPDTPILIPRLGAMNRAHELLGELKTAGMKGKGRLVVTAFDLAGNSARQEVPVVLDEPAELVSEFSVTPDPFSPNGDGRRERATLLAQLGREVRVTLDLRRSNGSLIRRLVDKQVFKSGVARFVWDGRDESGQVAADGDVAATLTAEVLVGGEVVARQEVHQAFVLDKTPPVITFLRPKGPVTTGAGGVAVQLADPLLSEAGLSVSTAGSPYVPLADLRDAQTSLEASLDSLPEGPISLRVKAADKAENQASATLDLILDRTPPKPALSAPLPNTYISGRKRPLSIEGAIDELHLASYRLQLGSTVLLEAKDKPASDKLLSWDPLSVADGAYVLQLRAEDQAGLSGVATVPVTVDNTLPIAQLKAADGVNYLRSGSRILGTASDANLAAYWLELSAAGGDPRWNEIGRGTTSVTDGALMVATGLPADGRYTLRLTVQDKAGNEASVVSNVVVDTLPPEPVTLSAEVKSSRDAHVSWTASSDPALAGYVLLRNGNRVGTALLSGNSYDDPGLAAGTYRYTVLAVDRAGNESVPSNEGRVVISTGEPVAQIFSPLRDSYASGLLDVRGTASAAADFKEYRVYVGAGTMPTNWQLLRRSPVPVTSDSLLAWNTVGLSEGARYTLKLEVENLSGLIASERVTVKVKNQAPKSPLSLSGMVSGDSVILSWTAPADPDVQGYLVYRDRQLANASGLVIGSLTPYLVKPASYFDQRVVDGVHRYVVQAMDVAGNLSDPSNEVELKVDVRPPHVTFSKPLNGAKVGQVVPLVGDSPDQDIAKVQFQYRAVGATAWVDIGVALTGNAGPWAREWNTEGLPYGSYQLRAVATDEGGHVDPAPTPIVVKLADLRQPSAATDLRVRVNGDRVSLSWAASASSFTSGYFVERIGSGNVVTRLTASAITALSYVDEGRLDGSYSYRVVAVSAGGVESNPSNEVRALVYAPTITQPFTPTGDARFDLLGRTPAGSSVQVSLERTGAIIGKLDVVAGQSFRLGGLPLDMGDNRLRVFVEDGEGNRSRELSFHVYRGAPPEQPSGLNAAVSGHQVTLSWAANAPTDLAGYVASLDGVARSKTVSASSATASGSLWGYEPYRAIDGSAATGWHPAYQSQAGGHWIELRLSGGAQQVASVKLNWANSPYQYVLEGFDGEVWVQLAARGWDGAGEVQIPLQRSYRTDRLRLRTPIEYDYYYELREFGVLAMNIGSARSATFSGLPDGRPRLGVQAVSSLGLLSPSAELVPVVGDVLPPDAPALSAAAAGSDITLSWSLAATPDLASFRVLRDGLLIATLGESARGYEDPARPNGRYTYTVQAVDRVGNVSVPSNAVPVDVLVTGPTAPIEAKAATPIQGGEVELSWTVAGGSLPARFSLLRSTRAGGPYDLVQSDLDASQRRFVDRTVANRQRYFYVVVGQDALGNVGARSNEVNAFPMDAEPPAAPFFALPGRSPGPVVAKKAVISLAGYATPGSLVIVSRNGEPIGEAVASPEPRIASYEGGGGGGSFDISRDASLVYSVGFSGTQLTDAAGQPVPSAALRSRGIYDVSLAPDGQSAAVWMGTDAPFGRHKFFKWDRSTDALTEWPIEAERNVKAFSEDGATLALAGRDAGGNEGVILVDWSTGQTRFLPGQVSYMAWAPDSRRLAISGVAGLRVLDTGTGLEQAVAGLSGPLSVAWLPDGLSLLVAQQPASGRRSIVRASLLDGAVTPVAQAHDHDYDWPTVSPDGTAYLALRDGSKLVQRTLSGEETELADGAGAPLYWTRAETVAYRHWSDYLVRTPQGQFRLDSVAINVGSNLFEAYARDDAGNGSAPALPLEVRLSDEQLPDWHVAEAQLQAFPTIPRLGETVALNVTIANRGMAAPATELSVVLIDPLGQGRSLYRGPLQALEKGGQQTVRLSWTPESAGRYLLLALVDPEQTTIEISEDNNQASREFLVVAGGAKASVQPGTDKTRYQSGEMVRIDTLAVNSGDRFDGVVQLRLLDMDGNELSRFEPRRIDGLQAGVPQRFGISWASGSTLAGRYQVVAELQDLEGRVLSRAASEFAIEARVDVVAEAFADHLTYEVGARASLGGRLLFKGGNVFGLDTTLLLTLSDSTGEVLERRELAVRGLMPGATVRLPMDWVATRPEDYLLTVTAGMPDAEPAHAEFRFSVLQPGTAQLQGRLQVASDVISTDEAINAELILSNVGAVLDRLPVRVRVLNPESGLPLADGWTGEYSDVGSDAITARVYLGDVWPLGGVELRLEAQVYDSWVSLDRLRLRVAERVAPAIAFNAPAAHAVVRADAVFGTTVTSRQLALAKVELRAGDGDWVAMIPQNGAAGRFYLSPLRVADGPVTLQARATDSAGNVSSLAQLPVVIDSTAPVIRIEGVAQDGRYGSAVTPTVSISDAHLLDSQLTLDGAPFVSGTPVTVAGTHTLVVNARDVAGNSAAQSLSFRIETAVVLNGSLRVSPDLVNLGAPLMLDARVINDSARALDAVQVVLELRDHADGSLLQRFQDGVPLPLGGTYQRAWTWTAAGRPGAIVDVVLSAGVGDQLKPLAQGTVQLIAPNTAIGMSSKLTAPGKLLVYLRCPRVEDDTWDNCGTSTRVFSDPAVIANCTADRGAWLTQYLKTRGVTHTLVSDEAAFLRELRSGRYGRYWLGGGALQLGSLAAAELQAAVRRGDTLLTEGWQTGHNPALEPVAGIVFSGRWSSAQAQVATNGPVLPVASLLVNTPVRFTGNAQRHATMNNGHGIVSSSFGQGRSMAFAFDLSGTLRAASDSVLPQWQGVVEAALQYLSRAPDAVPAAGGVLELRTTVSNGGTPPQLVDHVAKLPALAQVLQGMPEPTAVTLEGGLPTLRWRANVQGGDSLPFVTTVRLPLEDGQYVLPTLVSQVNADGSLTLLRNEQPSVRVFGPQGLVDQVYQDLLGLTVADVDAAAKAGTLGWLARAKLSIADGRWSDALRQLVAAQAAWQGASTAAAEPSKLGIARVIEAVERRL